MNYKVLKQFFIVDKKNKQRKDFMAGEIIKPTDLSESQLSFHLNFKTIEETNEKNIKELAKNKVKKVKINKENDKFSHTNNIKEKK